MNGRQENDCNALGLYDRIKLKKEKKEASFQMKVIKFIRPKSRIDDVTRCDSCGSKFKSHLSQFRSLDFSRFYCEKCKEGVDSALIGLGIDTKGYWKSFMPCVQTVPDPEKVFKPYRPRGRNRKRERTAANKLEYSPNESGKLG